MTRDSLWWRIGWQVGLAIGILAAMPDATLATYGIPVVLAPYLRLVALVLGLGSAKLGNSPLLGAPKAPKGGG